MAAASAFPPPLAARKGDRGGAETNAAEITVAAQTGNGAQLRMRATTVSPWLP